jgi:hypothetical protein
MRDPRSRAFDKQVSHRDRSNILLSGLPRYLPLRLQCNGSGCDYGDECMGIMRKFFLVLVIFFEVAAKPMWERCIDDCHRFAKIPTFQSGAATSRVVGNDHRKSRIRCSSPKRGFSQSRMSHHSDFCWINAR